MGNIGTVVQIIGPVVDIEFDEDHLPAIYNAVHIKDDGAESGQPIDVTAEVEQHLGENRVRCVSMEPTDGLVRGMDAVDTGAQIMVPVGRETLGRVLNVLGRPVDKLGELTLAFVLLAGALSAMLHYRGLSQIDLGYDPADLAVAEVSLDAAGYEEAGPRRQVLRQLEQRLASLPGIESVGATCIFPSRDGNFMADIEIDPEEHLVTRE